MKSGVRREGGKRRARRRRRPRGEGWAADDAAASSSPWSRKRRRCDDFASLFVPAPGSSSDGKRTCCWMMSNSEAKLYIPCDDERMEHSSSAPVGKSWVASPGPRPPRPRLDGNVLAPESGTRSHRVPKTVHQVRVERVVGPEGADDALIGRYHRSPSGDGLTSLSPLSGASLESFLRRTPRAFFGKFPAAFVRPGCLVTHPNPRVDSNPESRQAVSLGSIFGFPLNTQRNQSAKN
jgi:hypothetical protein